MKIKKLVAVILSALMLVILTACPKESDSNDEAEEYYDYVAEDKLIESDLRNEEYKYDEYENHIRITEYLLNETVVEIPAEINGKPVMAICPYAFSGKWLTTVIIPEGVTTIFYDAFIDCSYLENVTFPESARDIDMWAFYYTKWYEVQERPIIINNQLLDYSGASGDVVIPDGITKIGDYAFRNCPGLTSVTIPDSVTEIGGLAFEICTSLTEVTIPENVESIGYGAFSNCSGLADIKLPDSLTYIGGNAFYGTPWLAEQAQPVIINGMLVDYSSASGDVIIPDGVTLICGNAFSNCTDLIGVIIPNSVTSIDYGAFSYCSNLASVNIPDGVTEIGVCAFEACSSLTSITIPDSVTEIGDNAFYICPNLTNVTIPQRFNDKYDEIFGT